MRDYYSLASFLNNIDEAGLYNDAGRVPTPSLLLPNADQETAMKRTAERLEELSARVQALGGQREIAFNEWLAGLKELPAPAGLIADFDFDVLTNSTQLINRATTNAPGSTSGANRLAPGRSGQALEFTGDDPATLPAPGVDAFRPWDAYSVVLWIWRPAALTNGIIFHRTDGTDVGFHGVELSLEEGRLFFVLKRFWPGNAIAVRTRTTLPAGSWAQIAVTFDGSGRADGMRLYVDGRAAGTEILRDHLFKSPGNGGGGLTLGQRFRSAGLKGGRIDDARIYARALAPLEVAHLYDGHALTDAVTRRDASVLRPFYLETLDPVLAEARSARREAVRQFFEARDTVLETMVMEERPGERPTYVLARGRYDAPTTEDRRVTRTTPAAMLPMPSDVPPNRLGLARWLTRPEHPLTARVAVNRFWQMLFGKGLVTTTENFGLQGSPPSHPELLDWLARDFIDSGWDVKAMLRRLVLSATYRQNSALTPRLRERDPENRLWARGPSHRLPAEMIRDTALAASGLLDEDLGGPPVSPYQPGDLWRESNSMSPAYHQSLGTALYRRSLYTVWKRTAPMPNMVAFDAPSREVCVVKRSNTGTPQQAYVLLNDPQFVEAARVLAERMMREGGAQPEPRIQFAFQRLTGRAPDKREL
ncbi:MAG: DUF1553 domain-containing protein, partial [Fimbriimonas ginsengisoli]|nr:DUF1553 domain-containing protein [Fimbriimonas ginsengisoli]